MCYLGGPRCATEAKKDAKRASEAYAKDPTAENKNAMDKAMQEYCSTPEGVRFLRETGAGATADKLEELGELSRQQGRERERLAKLVREGEIATAEEASVWSDEAEKLGADTMFAYALNKGQLEGDAEAHIRTAALDQLAESKNPELAAAYGRYLVTAGAGERHIGTFVARSLGDGVHQGLEQIARHGDAEQAGSLYGFYPDLPDSVYDAMAKNKDESVVRQAARLRDTRDIMAGAETAEERINAWRSVEARDAQTPEAIHSLIQSAHENDGMTRQFALAALGNPHADSLATSQIVNGSDIVQHPEVGLKAIEVLERSGDYDDNAEAVASALIKRGGSSAATYAEKGATSKNLAMRYEALSSGYISSRKLATLAKSNDSVTASAALMGLERAKEYERLAKNTVPRSHSPEVKAYYEANDRKHFGDTKNPGSQFTCPNLKKTEDVVRMAAASRGHLSGDDRALLIARGASPDAFLPNCRYIAFNAPGRTGVVKADSLADDATVRIVRTKPGTPVSVVASVKEKPATTEGVLILGKAKSFDREVVLTAFPGPVTKPTSNSLLDSYEGQSLPVSRVKEILGADFKGSYFNASVE